MQCEHHRFYLPLRRKNAPEYRPEDGSPETNETNETTPRTPGGELVGNFIRTDQSLVIRRNRASRFSPKYRDGIVQKILLGTAMADIRRELNLSEQDLVDWIADMLARKQEKIEQLQSTLDQIQRGNTSRPRLNYDAQVILEDGGETIEGQVRSNH